MSRAFKALRAELVRRGLVPSTCREVGPYYYSRNGARKRARAAGHVANAVRSLARGIAPNATLAFPVASWDGKWRRTVASVAAEAQGLESFELALQLCQDAGILA